MPRRTRISLLSCVLALALAGCGSGDDGTIPPNDADNLLSLLSAVESEAEAGQCDLAEGHAQEFTDSVNALPGDVDPTVAGELTRAATNLDQLTGSDCTETGASGVLGDQSTSSTTETVVPETTTEESTTTTEEETTTTEEPPEEQPSEDPGQQPPGNQGGTDGGLEPPSGGVGAGGGAG